VRFTVSIRQRHGAAGAAGPPGTSGTGTGAFNGIQEFTQSGTFTVPAGVTHLLVELWGGGGGGGGATFGLPVSPPCLGLGGGGGGAGGYTRAVVPVTPGAQYTITVGAAGPQGFGPTAVDPNTGSTGQSGGAGGATQILDSTSTCLPLRERLVVEVVHLFHSTLPR
jgi:phage-related tail fiber protein